MLRFGRSGRVPQHGYHIEPNLPLVIWLGPLPLITILKTLILAKSLLLLLLTVAETLQ